MKEVFLSLFVVATIASGVGMFGITHNHGRDISRALTDLGGAHSQSGQLAAGTEGPGPTAGVSSFDEYVEFRARSYSSDVDQLVQSVCPEPDPAALRGCIRSTETKLSELFERRRSRAGLFRGLLLAGRALFVASGLVSLFWLAFAFFRILRAKEEEPLNEEPEEKATDTGPEPSPDEES